MHEVLSISPRVLYLIVCAAPPAQQTAEVVPQVASAGLGRVHHRHSPSESLDGSRSP